MTALGWIFMLGSVSFVWGLSIWCYHRVLTLPDEEAAVPEPVEHFHSA